MSHAINTLIAEDKAYQKWEREQKNHILNMTNLENKQKVWGELFGTLEERSDDYIYNGKVF